MRFFVSFRHTIQGDPVAIVKQKLTAAAIGYKKSWGSLFEYLDHNSNGNLDSVSLFTCELCLVNLYIPTVYRCESGSLNFNQVFLALGLQEEFRLGIRMRARIPPSKVTDMEVRIFFLLFAFIMRTMNVS